MKQNYTSQYELVRSRRFNSTIHYECWYAYRKSDEEFIRVLFLGSQPK